MFAPWIGPRYFSEGFKGKKILVLGESHYGEGAWDEGITKEVVTKAVFTDEYRIPFFKKIAKLLSKKYASDFSLDDFHDVWNRICFYNFIPVLLPKPRVAPSEEMWQMAIEPYKSIVKELNPDIVIVLGKRLFPHVPIEMEKTDMQVIGLTHPSSLWFRYSVEAAKLAHILRD